MKSKVALVTLMTLAVALAGCAGDSGPSNDQGIDGDVDEDFTLDSGKGAIAGLLVNDQYRPLELTEDPQTEFQASGFILLQELGLQVQTDQDGEFSFLNLDPGTYTLRAKVDGHEATQTKVLVEDGFFTEETLTARRISSQGSTTVSVEHTVYIDCAFDYIANGGNGPPPHAIGCDLDISSDGYSSDFYSDYSAYGANATYMITEMLANQEKPWELQMRTSCNYVAEWSSGDYLRVQMQNGFPAEGHMDNPGYDYCDWTNSEEFRTIFFVDHPYRQEHQDATGGLFCCGVGASLGIRAQILQTVFLGVPDESIDIDTFCALC